VVWCAQDAARQQEWKLERLVKENRALELANTELRTAGAALQVAARVRSGEA
jgi:hypothetical protein